MEGGRVRGGEESEKGEVKRKRVLGQLDRLEWLLLSHRSANQDVCWDEAS